LLLLLCCCCKKEPEKVAEPLQTRKTLKVKQGDDDGASVLDSVDDR
jgi:hypothetical protein